MLNYMTRRPVDSGATYTMNTQSGTGPGAGALTALSNMQNRRLAANRAAEAAYAGRAPAPAAQTGAPMGFTPEPVETSILPTYSGLPAGMEAQYSSSPAPLLATPDIGPSFPKNTFGEVVLDPSEDLELEAFTGQPSDPMYMPGGEFDAFVESTMAFPDFDGIRDNRDLMMDVFEKYKAMHRGKN
jgi:hypothetical protein